MYSIIKIVSKLGYIKKFFPFTLRCLSIANEDGVVKSLFSDINIPNIAVHDLMFQNFQKYPNKIAIECALTGKKYTYEEVLVKSKNFDKVLRKSFRFRSGDVIAVLLPNVPEYPICVLGCLQANVIVTPINPTYTPEEISKQLLDSGAKAIITISSLYSVAAASLKRIHQNVPIITIKSKETESLPQGAINLHELLNEDLDIDDTSPANANHVAVIPYSSGTTGLPKGVELTHKNIVSNIYQVGHPELMVHIHTTEIHQDVVPGILPFFHTFGLSVVLFVHMNALCKIVTIPRFSPEIFINLLERHKPQILFTIPSVVNLIIKHKCLKQEHFHNLRSILSGSAPLGDGDEEKLRNKIGSNVIIKQGYGLTETSPVVFMSSKRSNETNICGSSGELVPNTTVKIVNKDNEVVLTPNEPGELLIKGPQVMKGYFKLPEETKNAFADGYFKSGDLVYYDENQFFFVVDRLKELIKVKGFQVAPAELEGILRTHPNILDACVIGINHPRYGEVPRAYVVAKPNHVIKPTNVFEYVANQVVNYKHLVGGVLVVNSIPKNTAGKILRNEVKKLYTEENKAQK